MSKLSPSELVARNLRLAKQDPLKAYKEFARLYEENTSDPLVSFGLVYSASKAKTLIEALERISKRMASEYQGRRASAQPHARYVVPLTFGFALAFSGETEGSTPYQLNNLRPVSRFWYGAVTDRRLKGTELNRAQAALLASSKLALGDHAGVRLLLREYLSRNNRDSRLHLLLCRAYARGVVQRTRGNPPVPVAISDDEKPQEALALNEAKIALELEPEWPEPHYYVGLFNMVKLPGVAREHLEFYLAHGKEISVARRAVIERFLKGQLLERTGTSQALSDAAEPT